MTKPYDVFAIAEAKLDFYASVTSDQIKKIGLRTDHDNVYTSEQLLNIWGNLDIEQTVPGGSVANSISGLGYFNYHSYILGYAPDDKKGIFNKACQDHNITPSFYDPQKPLKGNLLVIVNQDTRERCFVNADYSGTDKLPPITPSQTDMNALKAARVLVLEGYDWILPTKRALHQSLAPIAKDNGTAVFLSLSDRSVVTKHADDLTPFIRDNVDVLCGNDDEFKTLTGKQNPAEIFVILNHLFPRTTFIMTAGEDGAYAYQNGIMHHAPCEAVEREAMKNTNGAGDAFLAGVIHAYLKKNGGDEWLKDALATGTVLSHYTIRSESSLPNPQDLDKNLPSLLSSLGKKISRLKL